jgi:DNA invertase Pin-like site-specific DNA recombinase
VLREGEFMSRNAPRIRPPIRAAQYVRMSTDRQSYSIPFQEAVLAAYALERGYTIVRTYSDSGISGLRLDGRAAMNQLLSDVLGGKSDFSVVLVYDVSRWGRFQDPDESAHYEFICRTAGVQIEYCAEPFDNDGTLTSTLVKHLKRAMAAEYSRELSDKITSAKRGLGLKGYWPGGNPSFGLRRCQVGKTGDLRHRLEAGEANALKGNRIVIVPGPPEEVAIVRRIFRMFTSAETTPRAIAKVLNGRGVRCWAPGGWTESRVRRVLNNELYVGTRLMGRAKTLLGRTERRPKDEWVRVPDACEPIISQRRFREVQRRIKHLQRYTDDQLLDKLRAILAAKGKLSFKIIEAWPEGPRPNAYRHRFGSMTAAYALVGYTMTAEQERLTSLVAIHRPVGGGKWNRLPISNEGILERLALLLEQAGYLSLQLIEVTPGLPRRETLVRRFGSVERAYELVGYRPGRRQRQCFSRRLAKSDVGPA